MIDCRAGIIGLSIGDAMGVPLEGKYSKELVTEMIGGKAHNQPKGTWSDDTSMTLATMDAIIQENKINCDAIGNNFVQWKNNNKYTANGKLFDIGYTCSKAIENFCNKEDVVEKCGLDGIYDNGSGSLMRMVPLIYWCFAQNCTEEEIYEIVSKISSITHRHEISIMGCFIYVLLGIELLKGKNKMSAYKNIRNVDYSKYFSDQTISEYKSILEDKVYKKNIKEIGSLGYIVDTLRSVVYALLMTDTYTNSIIVAINLGGDADTLGACTGGISGVYYGFDNINKEWQKDLVKLDYIEDMCDKFNNILNDKK